MTTHDARWAEAKVELDAGAERVTCDCGGLVGTPDFLIDDAKTYFYDNRLNVGVGCSVSGGDVLLTFVPGPSLPEWS